jgi:peptidoglycan/LPS O-acetylase OafA/YrhL
VNESVPAAPPATSGLAYRGEIDGLRAIAIAAVVIHHAYPAMLPGGFAGVDLFFVISGYLITGIIAADLAAGRFSLARFYERRVRRIVPALAAMLAGASLVGWAILTPTDFYEFAKSLGASALFGSNLLFARGVDYFASADGSGALIHTWTLGVEEQFYLLFPLVLLVTFRWRAKALLPVAALVTLASFALALWLAPRWPQGAFYLLPTRMWELGLGAVLALLPGARAHGAWAAAGLALIAAGFVLIGPETPAPGALFLLPTLGTALVIRFGSGEVIAARVLRLRVLTGLGLVSFGTYLWHQPLLFFGDYVWFGGLPDGAKLALLALAVLLGAASWRWIERPVRERRMLIDTGTLVLACGAALLLAAGAGAAGYLRALLPHAGTEAQRLGGLMPEGVWTPVVIPPADPLPYVLYGDSHAGQYYTAIKQRFGAGALVTETGCLAADGLSNWEPGNAEADRCIALPDALVETVTSREVRSVIWAQRWDRELFDAATGQPLGESGKDAAPVLLAAIERTIARLPRGTRIIIIGNSPTAWAAGPLMLKGWLRCRAYLNVHCPSDYPARKAEGRAISATLAAFAAGHPQVTYVDAQAPLCRAGRCLLLQDGTLNYWDGSHLTRAAADRVVRTMPPLPPPSPLP